MGLGGSTMAQGGGKMGSRCWKCHREVGQWVWEFKDLASELEKCFAKVAKWVCALEASIVLEFERPRLFQKTCIVKTVCPRGQF